jgi:hypothetical protein
MRVTVEILIPDGMFCFNNDSEPSACPYLDLVYRDKKAQWFCLIHQSTLTIRLRRNPEKPCFVFKGKDCLALKGKP